MAAQFIIECLDCKHQTHFFPSVVACPQCGSTWREAKYDYKQLAKVLPLQLPGRPFDIWRYHELLPIRSPNFDLSLCEGGTPLIQASNLGLMLGVPNLFIKDERRGPTISFKDRQAAITIAALKEAGITEMVVASTGNVAIAYSAYAARAGIKLWAFMTSLVPVEKMREVAIYGTQVIKVTGTYDQTKKLAAEFAQKRGIFIDQGAKTISAIEGMKTIAFEIAEQLTARQGQLNSTETSHIPAPWKSPEWYIQSVSGGMGPIGVIKGFWELKEMGLIDCVPKMGIIQVDGCAPMSHAWKQGLEIAEPINSPKTRIATLATGDPGRTYTLLKQRMDQEAGGAFENISDEDAFRAMHVLAKMEGVSAEPAAAVAIAGMIKLIRTGVIKNSDTVVVNITGHTMPIEPFVLGEGWAQSLVLPSKKEEIPEEGLLSALRSVVDDRYPRIMVVDDNPDARRLIRRILQAQGNYTIFEAGNGTQAIDLAKKELPNLIVLDLMMPEMDGFSVIDAIQANPDTADIPVIVVTAKELTREEKSYLEGHIQSLMQKGDFMSDELLDEVRALLR